MITEDHTRSKSAPPVYLNADGSLVIPDKITIKHSNGTDETSYYGADHPIRWDKMHAAMGKPTEGIKILNRAGASIGNQQFFWAAAYRNRNDDIPCFIIRFPWAWTNMMIMAVDQPMKVVSKLIGFAGMCKMVDDEIDYSTAFFCRGPLLVNPDLQHELFALEEHAGESGLTRIALIPNGENMETTDIQDLMLLAQYFEWLKQSDKLTEKDFQYRG